MDKASRKQADLQQIQLHAQDHNTKLYQVKSALALHTPTISTLSWYQPLRERQRQ